MGGAATGMDLSDSLKVAGELGIDGDLSSMLLSQAAAGMVEAWNDRLPQQGEA